MNEFILVYEYALQSPYARLGRLVCLMHVPRSVARIPRQLLPAVIDYTSPLASIASHVVVVVVVVAFVVCRPARKLYANVGGSRCCLRATHKTAN